MTSSASAISNNENHLIQANLIGLLASLVAPKFFSQVSRSEVKATQAQMIVL